MKKIPTLLALFFCLQSFAQQDSQYLQNSKKANRFQVATQVIKNNILTIPGDFKEMGKAFSNDWKRTATYAGGMLGLIAVDKYTTQFMQDHIEANVVYRLPNYKILNSDFQWFNGEDLYITASIASLYAGSLILNSEKGQIAATNAFKSLGYSFVISQLLLKSVFARERPQAKLSDRNFESIGKTRDNWDFGNFRPISGGPGGPGTAFPSLHATAFFAFAKVMQMEFDNYWIPYTFMTVVFMSKFEGHQHWVSDMVFGGILGTVIGRSVVNNSRKHRAKKENQLDQFAFKKRKIQKRVIPQLSQSMVGLQLIGNF